MRNYHKFFKSMSLRINLCVNNFFEMFSEPFFLVQLFPLAIEDELIPFCLEPVNKDMYILYYY